MRIRDLEPDFKAGLAYRGSVKGVRQKYYVFEAQAHFFVVSFSASKIGAGYLNVVNKKSVDYVIKRFSGYSGVTAKDVVATAKRTKHAPNAMAALNILYVLTALDKAEIEAVGDHQQLFFGLWAE